MSGFGRPPRLPLLRFVVLGLLSASAGFLAPGTSLATPAYYIDIDALGAIDGGGSQETQYDSRTDSPTGLTANNVSASITGTGGNPASGVETGSATASADLAQGTLRASAFGTWNVANAASGNATAAYSDTLDFNIAGATNTTQTNIGVTLHVDGITTGLSGFSEIVLRIQGLGTSNTLYSFGHTAQHVGELAQSVSDTSGPFLTVWTSPTISNSGVNGVDFTGEFTVLGPAPEVTIFESLAVTATGGLHVTSSTDFSNTASLNLTLPTGVSFTSASGVFLSAPFAEVPEPASLAILGIGLAGFVFGRFRRTTRRKLFPVLTSYED